MALGSLGVPFGSPSRIFNVPAPAGAAQGAFANQQALSMLAKVIGQALAQKKEGGLRQEDIAAQMGYQQDVSQFAQQGPMPGLEQIGQAYMGGQQPISPGTGQPFIGQPQMPIMQSRGLADLQGQMGMQQMFTPQPLLSRGEQKEMELYGKRGRPEPTAGEPFLDERGNWIQPDRFGNLRIVRPGEKRTEAQRQSLIRQREIAKMEQIEKPTEAQQFRLDDFRRKEAGMQPLSAQARQEQRLQKRIAVLESKPKLSTAEQKELDNSKRRLRGMESKKQNLREKLTDLGFDDEQADLALEIHYGLSPRAKADWDTKSDKEKIEELDKMERVAKGRYFGLAQGYEKAVVWSTLTWIQKEKSKIQSLQGVPTGPGQGQDFTPMDVGGVDPLGLGF